MTRVALISDKLKKFRLNVSRWADCGTAPLKCVDSSIMLATEGWLSKPQKIISHIVLTGCLHCCRSLYDERSHIPRPPLKDAVASMGCLWASHVKYHYMKAQWTKWKRKLSTLERYHIQPRKTVSLFRPGLKIWRVQRNLCKHLAQFSAAGYHSLKLVYQLPP